MKTLNFFWGRFRTKVTIVLILSLLFVTALSNFLIYQFSLSFQFKQLREELMLAAKTSVLMIDVDSLLGVPLNPEGINSEQFKIIAEKLMKIKKENPVIKYIYTMTKTSQPGILQFIVDPEPVSEEEKRKGVTSYPGDKYDASRFPEMLKAFEGVSADRKLTVDPWGVFLSGYAPIRDKNGKAVAILGVDMDAQDVYLVEREIQLRAIFVLIIGIFVSIVLSFLISQRITRPIKRLVEGTRKIAAGDLQYKVEAKGSDEISELAESFNSMATSLLESRKKLHDYFYRVVQSLVKILEAKDNYTRGHSERVAEYVEKIALKMGFSPEKVEMVKKAAQLHDIGKLGINERILNKVGLLTNEEWNIIREHPILGEEILRPISFEEEMPDIVRSHHERYDGQGYPDKIKGEGINVFSQIIAVADAYDAMTSSRAYRPALDKEKAIEEIKKNSRTQFNRNVVEASLAVFEEEKK